MSLEIFPQDIELAVNLAATVENTEAPLLIAAEAAGHDNPEALVQSIVTDPELTELRMTAGDLVVGAAAARMARHKRVEEAFEK